MRLMSRHPSLSAGAAGLGWLLSGLKPGSRSRPEAGVRERRLLGSAALILLCLPGASDCSMPRIVNPATGRG
jgi:hypothetical protein